MTILGIGVDLIEIQRIKKARFFDRCAEYILTPAEQQEMKQSRDQAQFLLSRFAAKEAVIKACPTTLSYRDIVIEKEGSKPVVRTRNEIQFQLSFSHSFTSIVAFAIAFTV